MKLKKSIKFIELIKSIKSIKLKKLCLLFIFSSIYIEGARTELSSFVSIV